MPKYEQRRSESERYESRLHYGAPERSMNKATIVRVDGTTEELDRRPTLTEAQQIVGGWAELVKVGDNKTLVVDEEGKLKGKPVNKKITQLYGSRIYGGYIVGDVIVLEGWKTVG